VLAVCAWHRPVLGTALRSHCASAHRLVNANHVVRVDDEVEGRHVPALLAQFLDGAAVAQDGGDVAVLDGIDDRVHAECGVDGRDDDGLRERALRGDLPLGASVLEDGEGAGRLELLEVGGGLGGDEAVVHEGGAEAGHLKGAR